MALKHVFRRALRYGGRVPRKISNASLAEGRPRCPYRNNSGIATGPASLFSGERGEKRAGMHVSMWHRHPGNSLAL